MTPDVPPYGPAGQPGQPPMGQPPMGAPVPPPMGQPQMGQPPMGQQMPPGMPPQATGQLPLDEQTPAYRLALRQKFTLVQNRFELVGIQPSGEEQLLAFAVQKRFSLKEKITFFTDESQSQVAFTIAARSVFELAATYDIVAGNGQPLASLRKDFKQSLLRSTYELTTPRGTLVARERTQWRPILRRVVTQVADVPWLLPLQFDIQLPGTEHTLVTIDRQWKIRDHYDINVYDAQLDWRLVGAIAVATDSFMQR